MEKEKETREKEKALGQDGAEREKLPVWFAPAWSTRAISLAVNVVLISYLAFYCTDMLGMNPTTVGAVLLVSKIFDGFTDLVVGYVIDKTNTKWGKARPYEWFIVGVWAFSVLLFSVPDMNAVGQVAWVFVFYTLINSVCATFLNGGDSVYMVRAIRKEENRVMVLSISSIIGMIAVMVFAIILPQMIAGMGSTKSGWTTMTLVFAVPFAIIGLLRFFLVKEVVVDASARSMEEPLGARASGGHGIGATLKAIFGNVYILLIAGTLLVVNVINGMGTAASYYFKYVMGDIGLQSVASMASLVTPFVLILYPFLQKKLGNTNLFRIGAAIGIVGMVVRTAGGANLATIVVGSICSAIAIMPVSMMVNLYLIDCMDYGEWKTNIRLEGSLASLTSFTSKVGAALASAFTGFIMGMAGYDGNLAVQSQAANQAIVGLYNVLPLIMFVILLALSLAYNLDKKLPQIHEELRIRHMENK